MFDSWQDSKAEFLRLTGEKKPKPKGFIDRTFNHTNLKTTLKQVDKAMEALDEATRGEALGMPDAIKKARSAAKPLKSAVASYLKVVEADAQTEIADHQGDKTQLYRGLKYLSAELQALVAKVEQNINQFQQSYDKQLNAMEKLAAQAGANLKKAIADAHVATKNIKADPTPAMYNSYFRNSNSPGRAVGASLRGIAKSMERGLLPAGRVDPMAVDELCAPYGTEHSERSTAHDDFTAQQVLAWVKEFEHVVKLAEQVLDDLG